MMKIFTTLLLVAVTLSFSTEVWAQNPSPDGGGGGGGLGQSFSDAQEIANNAGLSTSSPGTLIIRVVRILLSLTGLIAAAIIVYGGFLYITSAGDESKAEHAKQLIVYAVVGLLLIGAAAIIVNVAISIFQ